MTFNVDEYSDSILKQLSSAIRNSRGIVMNLSIFSFFWESFWNQHLFSEEGSTIVSFEMSLSMRDEVKLLAQSILIPHPKGLTLSLFLKEYSSIESEPLPYRYLLFLNSNESINWWPHFSFTMQTNGLQISWTYAFFNVWSLSIFQITEWSVDCSR